jgi:hypothetical protein
VTAALSAPFDRVAADTSKRQLIVELMNHSGQLNISPQKLFNRLARSMLNLFTK